MEGRNAFVGNVRHLDAGHALEQLGVEMVRRAGPARRVGELARMFLRIRHELGDRAHRQRWVDHEKEWNPAGQHKRHEVLDRIVGTALMASDPLPARTTVEPAGAAWAPAAVPITEPAPGRFSTTTDLPSRSDRCGATARQSASTAPPAGHGAIKVICRAG